MSYEPPYPVTPVGPPRPPRPRTVTAAAALMVAGAIVGVIGGVLTLLARVWVGREFPERAAETGASAEDIDRFSQSIEAAFLAVGIGAVVLGVVMGVLARLVLRGNNLGRILAWVMAAASLCCGCGNGMIVTAASNLNEAQLEGMDQPTAKALGQALSESLPPWFAVGGAGAACVQVLGYIAVAVLLALPASHEFFRAPPPATTGEAVPPFPPPSP